jgi:hypothetical protein
LGRLASDVGVGGVEAALGAIIFIATELVLALAVIWALDVHGAEIALIVPYSAP